MGAEQQANDLFEVLTSERETIQASSYEDALVWCCLRYGAIELVAAEGGATQVFISLLEQGPDMKAITDQRQTASVIRPRKDGLRYIAEPTPAELEEAKAWIRKNHGDYEDGFDCAVHCCHDLNIFDFDEYLSDPRQDRAIAHFIDALTQSFYAGAWV